MKDSPVTDKTPKLEKNNVAGELHEKVRKTRARQQKRKQRQQTHLNSKISGAKIKQLTPRQKHSYTAAERKKMKPAMPSENDWLAELQ